MPFESGQLERRSLPFDLAAIELRQDGEDAPRTIAWYPALFDTLSEDLWGFRERISRRAFTKALQEDDVRALVNHDPNQILGRTSKGSLKLKNDLHGLYAETALPQTSYASDLVANIGNGNISGGSFAFRAVKDKWDFEPVDGVEEPILVRTVQEARLFDVSLVTFPAYSATEGSASLRDLATEWRSKLAGAPPQQPLAPEVREMQMCALMKGMCASCESEECQAKKQMQGMDEMGERQTLPAADLSKYHRRLELLKLNK